MDRCDEDKSNPLLALSGITVLPMDLVGSTPNIFDNALWGIFLSVILGARGVMAVPNPGPGPCGDLEAVSEPIFRIFLVDSLRKLSALMAIIDLAFPAAPELVE